MAKSQKALKIFLIFLLVAGIIVVATGAILWSASYSSGSRTGRVIKLSNKGILFKTWEGELNMESLGHSKSTAGLSTVWQFSVDEASEKVLKELDSAMVNNLRVQLIYSEKYMLIKLRGETKYFITEVKFTDKQTKSEKSTFEKQLNAAPKTDSLLTESSEIDSVQAEPIVEKSTDNQAEMEETGETVANFEIQNNGCYAPCEVQFQNLSQNAIAYFWDFGDGQQSDENTPSHTFQTAGNYEVKLKAVRKDGTKAQKSKWVVIR